MGGSGRRASFGCSDGTYGSVKINHSSDDGGVRLFRSRAVRNGGSTGGNSDQAGGRNYTRYLFKVSPVIYPESSIVNTYQSLGGRGGGGGGGRVGYLTTVVEMLMGVGLGLGANGSQGGHKAYREFAEHPSLD